MNEPIADAARSILDGHVVLTRSLAHAGHYPAIDVLQSVSRLVDEIVPAEVVQAGRRLRSALAVLAEKEDLVAIGAYQPGSDPALDAALAHRAAIEAFLRQAVAERSDPAEADSALLALAASLQRTLDGDGLEIPDAEVLEPDEERPAGAGEIPAIPALGLSI
jgi:flagellum-specific ATP synthase